MPSGIVTHPLRLFLLACALITLPENIVASATLHGPSPIIGLVPLGLAAMFAFRFIRMSPPGGKEKARNPAALAVTAIVGFVNDVLTLLVLLAILILTWIYDRREWYWDMSSTFFVAYAAAPMILNIITHTFPITLMLYRALGVQERIVRLFIFPRAPMACPHCLHCNQNIQPADMPRLFDLREYRPVQARDEDRFHDAEAEETLREPERNQARVAEGSMAQVRELPKSIPGAF